MQLVQIQMLLHTQRVVLPQLLFHSLRYMHTTVESVHKDDVDNVIKLIYNALLKIKMATILDT